MNKIRKYSYKRRMQTLFKNPMFWLLTFVGNLIIFVGSVLLYYFESAQTFSKLEFIDCLLWSTSLTTTIGYNTFVPISFAGKITVIAMMLLGTLFVWSYMAFLVTALIAPELSMLEHEMQKVEVDLLKLKSEK